MIFLNRQICASCFVVDFEKKELLVIYNKKLGKWLQPGGHIEGEETPIETAMREVKEETGVDFKPIGNMFQNKIEPFAVESYNTRIGPMIDIQYIVFPTNKAIINNEDNNAKWLSLADIRYTADIDNEIKEKFNFILDKYTEKIISSKKLDPMQYGRGKRNDFNSEIPS